MRLTHKCSASRQRSLRAGSAAATIAVLAVVLAGAAVAVGAIARPTLVTPARHGSVQAHGIRLVVRDTSALAKKYGVFVSISRSRKTKPDGVLKDTGNVNKGESFVQLKKDRGHPGLWVYRPPNDDFPGYWASTPGRYYWQAEHTDCEVKGCEAVSMIGTFTVTG